MAGAWLAAVKETGDVEWAGFVDIKEEAARKRADESGALNPVIGADLEQVLKQTRPDETRAAARHGDSHL